LACLLCFSSSHLPASDLSPFSLHDALPIFLIGFALLAASSATDSTARNLPLDWRSAVWLWPYLLGMGAISYLGSFDTKTPSSIADRKSTRLNSSHQIISYAVFCLTKK